MGSSCSQRGSRSWILLLALFALSFLEVAPFRAKTSGLGVDLIVTLVGEADAVRIAA